MAKSTLTIAKQLADWQKLVTNVIKNQVELPPLELYSGPLEQVLEDAKELDARLQSRVGVKQQETKDRRERMRTGRFCASKLRSALRAHYGFQSERLLEYGIRPLRTGKKQPEEPPPEPAPETAQVEGATETAKAPQPEDPTATPEAKPAPRES